MRWKATSKLLLFLAGGVVFEAGCGGSSKPQPPPQPGTPAPTLASLSPTSGPAGTAVVISGSHLANASAVSFNGTAATFTVNSATQITTAVPAGASSGAVSVTTPGGTATGPSFTVTLPAPTVSSLNPTSGLVGSTVVITGTNLANTSAVSFNGTAATFTVNSATQITAAVPAGASSGAVSVTTPGGTATGPSFTVTLPAPTVSSLNPTSGLVGSTVVITGTNLANASAVTFNGTAATFTVNSATQITAAVPAGASSGAVSVTTPGGTATGPSFTVTLPAPTVSSLNPTSGPVGSTVVITGTSLMNASAISFYGTPVSGFTVNSDTQITTTVPSGATTGAVSVTTPGGTATGPSFTVTLPAPTVSSLNPTSGQVGSSVVITGTNLIGASAVSFNGTAATFTVNSAAQITTSVPAGATSGTVSVTTPGGTATGPSFTVNPATPTLTAVNPSSGLAGDHVVLTGTNLTGATAVSFNGTAATTFTVDGATQITATVPAGATTGAVSVTTPGGVANGPTFTLTVPAPTVTGLSPTSGAVGASVTITGTNLTNASAVSFNGTTATFTVNSATQITATVPAGAATGAVSVMTPGGTANGPVFTVSVNTGVTYNALVNADFELGTVGWSAYPPVRVYDVTTDPAYWPSGAHGGRFVGYMGGGEADERLVGQVIRIPASATRADLHFWLVKDSAVSDALDVFTVEAADPATHAVLGTLFTTNGGTAPAGWHENVADLKAFAGQTVLLQFHGKPVDSNPNATDRTAWSVDDLNLQVDAPLAASLPANIVPDVNHGVMGSTPVTLTGLNFAGATEVRFGGVASTKFTILDGQTLQVTVPPLAKSGPITVVTPRGNGVSSADFQVRTADLMINGNFEGFRTGWNASVCNPPQNMRVQSTDFGGGYPATPHSGTSFALIGLGSVADQRVAQDVTIPAGTTIADFSFWLYMAGGLPAGDVNDTLSVTVEDLSGTVLKTVQAFNGTTGPLNAWAKYSADLSAFAGQTVRISFRALSSASDYTNWYIDDVALEVDSSLASVQSTVTGFAFEGAPVTQLIEGSDLQIKGSHFYGVTGISFNGVPAAQGSFKVLDPGTILVTVPAGAQSGPVTVQTGHGDALSPSFTVLKAAADLVINGTFELGRVAWPPINRVADYSLGGWDIAPMKGGGNCYGYVGSEATATKDLHQVISIPAACNQAILSYYQSTETGESAMGYDTFTAQVIDGANTQVLQSLDAKDYRATTLWIKRNFDLSAYRGKTITLQFQGNFTDSSASAYDWSYFYVDNVSLLVDTTDASTLQATFTGFSPASGFPGETQITLTGSNFFGVTAVKFNGTAATFAVNDANTIQATVPPLSTSGLISIETVRGNVSSATPFNVTYRAPAGLVMMPASGPVGTPIVITGQYIDKVTSVTVNGSAATFSQDSGGQVTAVVPAGATSGAVVISNPTQSTTVGAFTVTADTVKQDIWIDHVLVSQATQNATQTTSLVKDRSCAVRVYVKANIPGLKPVVRISVMNGAVETSHLDVAPPSAGTPLLITEAEANVWTGVLSPQAIQPGFSLVVKIDPDALIPELNRSNDTWPAGGASQSYPVVDTKPMRISFVPLAVSYLGTTYVGDIDANSITTYTDMFHRIWPLPDALDTSLHATYTTSNVPAADYSNWTSVLNELLALEKAENVTNRYYYGVYKPYYNSGGTGMAYLAQAVAMGLDWNSTAGSSSVWTWRAGTVAHELGHSLSRPHSPCGGAGSPDAAYPYADAFIGQLGVDPFATGSQLRTYDAYTFHDVMAYCGYTWVSDYVYQKVMDYRLGGTDPTLQGPVGSGPAATQDCLLVWGDVINGEVRLRPGYVIQSAPDAADAKGTYRADLLDEKGQSLGTLAFEPTQADHSANRGFALALPLGKIGKKTQSGLFGQGGQISLPAVSGLRIHRNGEVLAERQGASSASVSAASSGASGLEPLATRLPDGRVRFLWDQARHPGVMIRNGKGEVICFGEGGEVLLKTDATELDVQFSDGVTSTGTKVSVR
ncbi:hypothetical protein GETHLI_12610 [Geothrix limicola]|uniref:IPT/TIG domain-containing protein n=1 Tax=Geothrix limicola TaxID=2927978 RepID=A0ABQ5QD43_9BACT|nr:IPT/TIG domain-containing protein [Geothrix limicola]GLH72759.1 hypothetical protein GETHLI_12610 [Geothrix limicola]